MRTYCFVKRVVVIEHIGMKERPHKIKAHPLVALLILITSTSAFAQTRCLTADEIKRVSDQIAANDTRPFNKKLSDDLIKLDRKSTRLNSSHLVISYAVFCLKKKTRHT